MRCQPAIDTWPETVALLGAIAIAGLVIGACIFAALVVFRAVLGQHKEDS